MNRLMLKSLWASLVQIEPPQWRACAAHAASGSLIGSQTCIGYRSTLHLSQPAGKLLAAVSILVLLQDVSRSIGERPPYRFQWQPHEGLDKVIPGGPCAPDIAWTPPFGYWHHAQLPFLSFFSPCLDVCMYTQVPAPLAHYEKANWSSQGGQ